MERKFYMIDERIHSIPQETLSWVLKVFYSRLAFRCNHKNKSWWSKKKLAKDFHTTSRNIQRWWRRLENLGLIEIHKKDGSNNEISISELTEDLLITLGVPQMSREGRQQCLRGGDNSVSPIIKGKLKMKKENGDGEAAARKVTVDSLWSDPDVIASGDRAIAASKKRGAMPTIQTSVGVKVTPETEEDFNTMIARWTQRQWSQAFVKAMDEHGYSVAFAKYKTVDRHVSGVVDHLHRRELSRLKIYRFLLEWFPSVYSSICETEFKKNQDDFMFSVSWMEPRLSRLLDLYEEGSHSKRPSTKKKRIAD